MASAKTAGDAKKLMLDAHMSKKRLQLILKLLMSVSVIRVTLLVFANYRRYLPPDFTSDFLQGRESYFFGSYRWAFYTHIVFGPLVLVLGTLLISHRFRNRWPRWHRIFGRIQTACILLCVVPSGSWMAFYADAGVVAGAGFAALSLATAVFAILGFRAAVRRRFVQHRLWMWRCYLMLFSAVVLRIIGGIAIMGNLDTAWTYPFAAWASWLIPWAIFELSLSKPVS